MRKNPWLLNSLLAVVVGLACLAAAVTRALAPEVILPRVSLPNLVLLCLIALVLEHYLADVERRMWLLCALLAGATFTLLPWCAGLEMELPLWKLFLLGGGVFGVTTALYTAIGRRMDSGPRARLAPVVHGLGLYLTSQCLHGLL